MSSSQGDSVEIVAGTATNESVADVRQMPPFAIEEVANSESTGTATSINCAGTLDLAQADLRGVLLGLAAATTYSIANLALRGLAKTDGGVGWSMWVAGTKAFPTFVVAVILISIGHWKGQKSKATWSVVWPIAVAAFFNQLGGNLAFQLSLVEIGLTISVPICFASIICSGAVVGRVVLGDPVSVRTGISMSLMVASIVFLSTAAKHRSIEMPSTMDSVAVESDNVHSTNTNSHDTMMNAAQHDWGTAVGVALAVISGLAYGITGVYIRKAVRSQLPVSTTLFLFSAAGFLVLCPLSLMFLPLSTIASTTFEDWATIAAAGIFNAIGFFAITHAMRHLTISRTNVINASQNALCAIGAMFVFGESLSGFGFVGIGLTIAGLLTLDRK